MASAERSASAGRSPLHVADASEVAFAGAGGAKAKCVGGGVAAVVVLAIVGGVAAWIVLRHADGKSTTPIPLDPEAQGGKHCAMASDENSSCLECHEGYELFGSDRCFYKCNTDLSFDVVKGSRKGLALDDTTLHWCPDSMPFHWPNTDEPVSTIRMFKAWQGDWEQDKHEVWEDIARYLNNSGAKVLIGTQVSCDPEADDQDWEDVKAMMQIFGPDHVMGVAIGNEMDLIHIQPFDGRWVECMTLIWTEGYYLDVFHQRVQDLNSLGAAYTSIPIMSVFSAAIFAGWPFVNLPVNTTDPPEGEGRPNAGLVMDFLDNVTVAFADRWVWSINIYPYWDPNNGLDADGIHCRDTVARATCLDPASGDPNECLFTGLVAGMRDRMEVLGNRNGTLWVGETGWSFPQSESLTSDVKECAEYSSEETFQKYYRTFLDWDMNMTGNYSNYTDEGPDHVFWFTMRDSSNFGKTEGFGLMGGGDSTQWCTNATCKLQDRGLFTTGAPGVSSDDAAIV